MGIPLRLDAHHPSSGNRMRWRNRPSAVTRHLTVAAAFTLILSACGGGSGLSNTVPPDPEVAVLTVTTEGGFVPPDFRVGNLPRYVVGADHTLYYHGPVPEIFPGPLLPNVQMVELSGQAWKDIFDVVAELGLPDYAEKLDDQGADQIADAGTDVITYHDANGDHRLAIYALGVTNGSTSQDRLLATDLMQILDDAAFKGESQPFSPLTLQVAAGDAGLDVEPGMAAVQAWPLDVTYADMTDWIVGWRCVEVGGPKVSDLMGTFGDANLATLWDTGTEQVNLRVVPLMPGQEACPTNP